MSLNVNLRHLEKDNVRLEGELSPEEVDLDIRDELIDLTQPVRYELEAQQVEDGMLVNGRLTADLECRCARCLKPFVCSLELENWTVHLPFEGEEAVPVNNDCVDLTPFIREDILLAFPQHPLCETECRGLPQATPGSSEAGAQPGENESSAWSQLDKLKFNDI